MVVVFPLQSLSWSQRALEIIDVQFLFIWMSAKHSVSNTFVLSIFHWWPIFGKQVKLAGQTCWGSKTSCFPCAVSRREGCGRVFFMRLVFPSSWCLSRQLSVQQEVVGHYPLRVTVISFGFKKKRFADLHRSALRFPSSRWDWEVMQTGEALRGSQVLTFWMGNRVLSCGWNVLHLIWECCFLWVLFAGRIREALF